MTLDDHLDASVERVMRALHVTVSTNSEAEEADFAAAVRDQLAQQFQIVACDLDEAASAARELEYQRCLGCCDYQARSVPSGEAAGGAYQNACDGIRGRIMSRGAW